MCVVCFLFDKRDKREEKGLCCLCRRRDEREREQAVCGACVFYPITERTKACVACVMCEKEKARQCAVLVCFIT